MSLYQRKVLATGELIGNPAPLPEDLWGFLTDDDLEHLADLNPAEHYAGQGFFRVPDPDPATVIPDTVPMYKIKKFLAKMRLEGGPDLHSAIISHFEALSEPARTLALIDFGPTETSIGSPNFVVGSPLVQDAKAALCLTDEQFGTMVMAADAIP